jgi:hypothetical protein
VGTGERATDGTAHDGLDQCFGCAQSSLAPMPLLFRAAAKARALLDACTVHA